MILVDLNQVILSGLLSQIQSKEKKVNILDEDLLRHLILNILRMHVRNFRPEYGEVVLCSDNRNYWRRGVFPFYKHGRKKDRQKSDLDWHLIFDMMAKFKEELKEYFPYKVIDVEGAEADDIIGTLAPRAVAHENVLILSSDGDFIQLQRYNTGKYKIKQYSPTQKKYVTSDDPILHLKEKIIRGDKGDGIPNIYSPSNCFAADLRQKPISAKKVQQLIETDISNWNESLAVEGFSRNQMLIDLTFIPTEISERIVDKYEEYKPAPKMKMMNYFVKYKLKNLLDVIEEF